MGVENFFIEQHSDWMSLGGNSICLAVLDLVRILIMPSRVQIRLNFGKHGPTVKHKRIRCFTRRRAIAASQIVLLAPSRALSYPSLWWCSHRV